MPNMRRDDGIATWRRIRRVVLIATVICLLPAGVSYVRAMTQPYGVGLGVDSVEWLRSNGGNGLVSQVENWYYSLTAPSKGGPALRSLPQVGVHGPASPAPAAQVHTHAQRRRPAPYRPPNIKPVIHPALPGEGVWRPAAANAGRRPPVLVTTFRSSSAYPQFVAGVAWIDSGRTRLAYMPGTQEPPRLANRGPSEVPPSLRSRVVATFNGGFPLSTSNAGLIYRGQSVAPMVNGIATLTGYRSSVALGAWIQGASAPANVSFAKQNLPLIIDHGKLNPNLSNGPQWGFTVNNAVRVWRSGVGIDRQGNLIYAAANFQTVGSLAQILKRAGAVRALELDINQDWVSFITYKRPGAGDPSNLLPDMFRSPDRYLTPDQRDFFAVYSIGGHP